MAIELRLQLKMSQQLVMTPQLQQAIKLLQLNRLELVNVVQQELTENPVLEEVEGEEEPTPGELADMTPGEERTEAGTDDADADPVAADLEGLPTEFLDSLESGKAADATSVEAPASEAEAAAADADRKSVG